MDLSAAPWAALAVLALVLCAPRTWRRGRELVALLTGRPHVLDGDTIRIGTKRIRLAGIDAPEMGQRIPGDLFGRSAGALAAAELRRLIGPGPVRVEPIKTDRYGRTIARLYAGEHDLGAEMIRRGYAVAYGSGESGYRALERRARQHGAGLWALGFERPSAYRKRRWG